MRILATLAAAALVVALVLAQNSAQAELQTEHQSVGMPLKLTPTFRSFRHVERPAIGRPTHRLAQPIVHRAHPMARPVAARRTTPVTLAAADTRSVDELVPTFNADERHAVRSPDTT